MSYREVDIFGVYVAPIAPMLLAASVIVLVLNRLADRYGLLRYVWHPPLFCAALYVIVLAAIVLSMGL